MDTANKQPVHPDDETTKLPEPVNQAETLESLRKVICLADDAITDVNRLREECITRLFSCTRESSSPCNEEEQKDILKLFMEADVFASKWVKAISYALMMNRRAKLMVDTLLLDRGKEGWNKVLAVVKTRIDWLGAEWQKTLSDVEKVSQYTADTVKKWKAAILPGRGLRKMLDSRSAYQAIEKMNQIRGCFHPYHFRLPFDIRDELLRLEARSSPLLKDDFLNKEVAMKDVQQAVLIANKAIAQMIHSMTDTYLIKEIAPLIKQDKILENLAKVKNWASAWDQMVTHAGNAIWQIVQTADMLLSTMDKNDEYKIWIEVRDEAEKMFQFLYLYIYGIRKLYHHSAKAEASWRSLPDRKKQFSHSWYQYEASSTTEEEKKAIEATLCIGYQFRGMFYGDVYHLYNWRRDAYDQFIFIRFAQISHDWILFQAKLLELEMPSLPRFAPQNPDHLLSPSLHSAHLPSPNIEQEVAGQMERVVLQAEQQIIRAVSFTKKWPKHEKVSLLNAEKSLEILKKAKKLVSDWSLAMSTAKDAVQEIVELLASKNQTHQTKAESILSLWSKSVEGIHTLFDNILQAETNWQALVTAEETSTTDFSLNSASVCETGVSTEPSATIHVNVYVSLDPEQTYSSLWKDIKPHSITGKPDFTTKKEWEAILATRRLVDSAQKIWGYLTGENNDKDQCIINSDGLIKKIERKIWSPRCISYNWMLLKTHLLNL
jgi:hypothetical protein